MTSDILHDSQLEQRYACQWEADKVLFREGEDCQDLYILVSGSLEVLKGEQKIDLINEPGSIFGEMSWLLGSRRTATVKAKEPTRLLCVPRDEVESFLQDHPQVAQQISRHLAKRLDQTTRVVFGLKELCDHLPDAVILSDAQGRIIAFNAAAGQVYGRDWSQMQGRPVEEVYQEPEEYHHLEEQVRGASVARERVLKIKHPTRGQRLISTSMTCLMDQERQVQGLISLGRDVTKLERIRRLNRWLLPTLALVACLGLGAHWVLPQVWPSSAPISRDAKLLQGQIAKDYLLLSTLLKDTLNQEQAGEARARMEQFLAAQDGDQGLYSGVILLDADKKVLAAISRQPQERPAPQPGSTYANLRFEGPESSPHKLVVLYRTSPNHPGGLRSLEVALELRDQGHGQGWLLLPIDMDYLKERYGMEEQALAALHFDRR